MMKLCELMRSISLDSDPAREGFQAQWSYIAANMLVSLATGLLVAAATTVVCMAFRPRGKEPTDVVS